MTFSTTASISAGSLAAKLAPLAERLRGSYSVVRPVSQVVLQLRGKPGADAFELARNVVIGWIKNRAGRPLPPEVDKRVRADVRKTGDFPRVHALPQSGQDVPDDMDARLVVLGIDHPYSKEPGNAAESAAKAIFDSRGNTPPLIQQHTCVSCFGQGAPPRPGRGNPALSRLEIYRRRTSSAQSRSPPGEAS